MLGGSESQFRANYVGREAGAEEAAIKRRKLALIERAANVRKVSLEARADGRGLVGLGKDGVEGGFDVAVGYATSTEFAGDAEPSLAARISVLARVIEGVAGIVEVVLFTKAGNRAIDMIFGFGAAFEILPHFVNRVCATHQGTKGGGMKLSLG